MFVEPPGHLSGHRRPQLRMRLEKLDEPDPIEPSGGDAIDGRHVGGARAPGEDGHLTDEVARPECVENHPFRGLDPSRSRREDQHVVGGTALSHERLTIVERDRRRAGGVVVDAREGDAHGRAR